MRVLGSLLDRSSSDDQDTSGLQGALNRFLVFSLLVCGPPVTMSPIVGMIVSLIPQLETFFDDPANRLFQDGRRPRRCIRCHLEMSIPTCEALDVV